jgi:hypothetical protein
MTIRYQGDEPGSSRTRQRITAGPETRGPLSLRSSPSRLLPPLNTSEAFAAGVHSRLLHRCRYAGEDLPAESWEMQSAEQHPPDWAHVRT